MSLFRTGILLAAMTALFLGVGYLLGGQGGMMIAFIVALGMNAFSYWNSDKMVLKMHGAREATEREAPELYGIVRGLTRRAGLPMLKVYIMDNPQPNAFATGRDPEHAAVAATSGLMTMLSRDELAGVMAHELAHVKNRDTLIMTVTATIAGAISMLASYSMFFGGNRNNNPLGLIGTIALMILAPMAAGLVQMAISRTREYQADRIGAEISGSPLSLASALNKIELSASRIPNDTAEANPATAHLFIANPLSGESMDNLFSTHPSMENRIARLEAMAREMGRGSQTASPRRPRHDMPSGPWSGSGSDHGGERGPWG